MSDQPIAFFESRYGVTTRSLERVMGLTLGGRIDDGDLYFEYTLNESISLDEGIVKKASKNISQGVGIRAIAGEKTGYAYSDEITVRRLEEAASTARAVAERKAADLSVPVKTQGESPRDLYPVKTPVTEVPVDQKIALLERVDRAARGVDPRIKNVMASFATETKIVLIATSDGRLIGDVQPLTRLSVSCIAEDGGVRQIGSYGGGGRGSYDDIAGHGLAEQLACEAARQAVLKLSALPSPAGTMTVVLGPGWPGILLHEAIGHGLEGDFNRKGTSAFAGRIGERVASELCTIVDDGTIPFRRGSLNVDDEGTTTQRTVLIEKGVLKGYLQDRLNARLMKMAPTGNGRRESFGHIPMPRMTNTFMLAGDSDPAEIIRSVKKGLYAVSFGGGQVDITNGKFVFSASEAYLIEDGKVTSPVRDATLIGNGPDVLTRVSMVGSDMALDPGIGTCGKDGQSVPVGVGLPTIRIDGLTVGGTQG